MSQETQSKVPITSPYENMYNNSLDLTEAQKRKRDQAPNGVPASKDTSKPTAVFQPTRGRDYTLSVAVPGSIISNAQSHELKTILAGQIARALAVFCVDEVIVFEDGNSSNKTEHHHHHHQQIHPSRMHHHDSQQRRDPSQLNGSDGGDGYTGYSDPNHFLAHILSYLETPPHLRRSLFPIHPNLRTAGTLPSLDMPHHFRAHEWCQFREGVTVKQQQQQQQQQSAATGGTPSAGKRKQRKQQQLPRNDDADNTTAFADVGLAHPVILAQPIPLNQRVTVQFPSADAPPAKNWLEARDLNAVAVAPTAPREEAGYYWGYSVRSASSLSAVFTESPFDGGYDVSVGTSERGRPLRDLTGTLSAGNQNGDSTAPLQNFSHLLLCFGGVAGLEVAVESDAGLKALGVESPEALFDLWVNLCPGQGSRTIRTEEAVWLGLMAFRPWVERRQEQRSR